MMSEKPDESQCAAIYAPASESVLVTAPPGYGKTFVMPKRVEYLVRSGSLVAPQRVLGLTFTNAAASEMHSRLEKSLRAEYLDYVDVTTFHSFCYCTLRAYGDSIKLSQEFRVLPMQEKNQFFKEFSEAEGRSYESDNWYGYKEWERNAVLKLNSPKTQDHLFASFWDAWKKRQIVRDEVDFNHLLWFTHELLSAHPEVLEIYRKAYSYILVDEFQDTNPIQFLILSLLSVVPDHQPGQEIRRCPIFIFADDWQSIYGFLGAVPEQQIMEAKKTFGCREVELTEDHRTASPALSLFGRLLRTPQFASSQVEELDIPFFILGNPHEMAEKVDYVVQQWVDQGIPLHEIAILARHKWQLEGVRDALSYEFLSVPDLKADGLESASVFKALISLSKHESSEHGVLRRVLEGTTMNANPKEGQEYIRRTLLDLAGNYDLRYPTMTLREKARQMTNEALLEMNWGRRFRDLCRDRIFLGTLHSVKGLEFRAVAIVHLDEGSFPYWRFVCQQCKKGRRSMIEESIREEWRVFYVGVTRAIEELALFSSATNRYGYATPVTCLIDPALWDRLDVVDGRGEYMRTNDIGCTRRDETS
jgi:superfamily I DNA/RNA helicase